MLRVLRFRLLGSSVTLTNSYRPFCREPWRELRRSRPAGGDDKRGLEIYGDRAFFDDGGADF